MSCRNSACKAGRWTFEINLKLGQVTETVEVNAAIVAVNKTDATIGTVIQQEEIVEIPAQRPEFRAIDPARPGRLAGSRWAAADVWHYGWIQPGRQRHAAHDE